MVAVSSRTISLFSLLGDVRFARRPMVKLKSTLFLFLAPNRLDLSFSKYEYPRELYILSLLMISYIR